VVIQFLVIGETTPVLGALTRYRTIALPFLFIGLFLMLDKERLLKDFPVLLKLKRIRI
jgi:hypothetical protein